MKRHILCHIRFDGNSNIRCEHVICLLFCKNMLPLTYHIIFAATPTLRVDALHVHSFLPSCFYSYTTWCARTLTYLSFH